jgi:hypothetical protein
MASSPFWCGGEGTREPRARLGFAPPECCQEGRWTDIGRVHAPDAGVSGTAATRGGPEGRGNSGVKGVGAGPPLLAAGRQFRPERVPLSHEARSGGHDEFVLTQPTSISNCAPLCVTGITLRVPPMICAPPWGRGAGYTKARRPSGLRRLTAGWGQRPSSMLSRFGEVKSGGCRPNH